jgi:hypothetical protein
VSKVFESKSSQKRSWKHFPMFSNVKGFGVYCSLHRNFRVEKIKPVSYMSFVILLDRLDEVQTVHQPEPVTEIVLLTFILNKG